MTVEASKDPTYLTGRSEAETRRLMAAVRILSFFTRRMLRDASIATEEEVDIDILAARLRAETVEVSGVVKGPDTVSAWARVP